MVRLNRKRKPLVHAVLLGLTAALAAWVFSRWDGAFRLVMLLAVAIAYVALALPHVGVAWLDRLELWARAWKWKSEQGRHHAFAGQRLRIDDDGRHLWIDGDDLKQVLGRDEDDRVLAARHAGRWRRTRDGDLQLRVDTVVEVLATDPGRMDPRQVRLRRYLERDLLFPAAERRRRQSPPQA